MTGLGFAGLGFRVKGELGWKARVIGFRFAFFLQGQRLGSGLGLGSGFKGLQGQRFAFAGSKRLGSGLGLGLGIRQFILKFRPDLTKPVCILEQ